MLYTPGTAPPPAGEDVDGTPTGDYARLIMTPDRGQFYATYAADIRPTTDDRPFFFHTTKLKDQFGVAFGRSMLFGNGLSALLTLLGIAAALVVLFVVGPLLLADRGIVHPPGWFAWLMYFSALGMGFMLDRGVGAAAIRPAPRASRVLADGDALLAAPRHRPRRRVEPDVRRTHALSDRPPWRWPAIAAIAVAVVFFVTPLVDWAIPFPRPGVSRSRSATLVPMGLVLGIPMPTGLRLIRRRDPDLVAWAWGLNGALSVLGATLAIFLAMNWGFGVHVAGRGGHLPSGSRGSQAC